MVFEHYIKLNMNLVSLRDRQTYGAIHNESLFFMRDRKKNLFANDALFWYFHKYYSRDKYNHFKEHSVGLLELNYLQRGKTIVVECTEEKPQNLETPSMHWKITHLRYVEVESKVFAWFMRRSVLKAAQRSMESETFSKIVLRESYRIAFQSS